MEREGFRGIEDPYLLHLSRCVAKPVSLNIAGGKMKPDEQSIPIVVPGTLKRGDGSVYATDTRVVNLKASGIAANTFRGRGRLGHGVILIVDGKSRSASWLRGDVTSTSEWKRLDLHRVIGA